MRIVNLVLSILQLFALTPLSPNPSQLRSVLTWALTHDKMVSFIIGLCIVAFVFKVALFTVITVSSGL